MTFPGADGAELSARGLVDDLLAGATVRVQDPRLGSPAEDEPAGQVWGSGFFVAPGLLLTNAHVLWPQEGAGDPGRGDGKIGVATADRVLTGSWAAALPGRRPRRRDGDLPPWPDLALVRVEEPDEHPCVWLSEDLPTDGCRVAVRGYAAVYQSWYAPWRLDGNVNGVAGPRHERRFQIDNPEVPYGTSGGPVLDLDRGGVWATCTAKRGERRAGGVVTPVLALRALLDDPGQAGRAPDPDAPGFEVADGVDPAELFRELWHGHDRYHWRCHRDAAQGDGPGWVRAVASLTAQRTGADPELLARLRGELAELPLAAPGVVLGIVERMVPHLTTPGRLPVLWRDGLDLILGLRPALSASRWLEYRDEAERQARARSASPGSPLPAVRPGRVVLRVEAAKYPAGQYIWSVARHQGPGRGRVCGQSGTPVPEGDLVEQVGPVLVRALAEADQGAGPAVLEVCVPLPLFDLPVDEWVLRPAGNGVRRTPLSLPLGVLMPVVVRDAEREGPDWAAAGSAAVGRWAALAGGPLEPLPLPPEAAEDWRRVWQLLDEADPRAVPLWSGAATVPPGDQVMDAIAVAGHSVVLWRRGGDERSAPDFLLRLAELVQQQRNAGQLPFTVQQLRKYAFSCAAAAQAHWAAGVVLLYDSPRASPSAPLTTLD